jgi:hypothetical protein
VLIWSFNRFVRLEPWAKIGPQDWKENWRPGFTWDTDTLDTNLIAHSYQGALFHNAARDNGFGYWGCLPFTIFGSLQWELFFEDAPPSINDNLATPLGGLAFGEVLYRLSSMVLDNRASGSDRWRRELVAGFIAPMRGLNRLLTGEVARSGPTPPQWRTDYFGAQARVGGVLLHGDPSLGRFILEATIDYGDPFRSALREPFDAFHLSVQLGGEEERLINRLRLDGMLGALKLGADDSSRLLLAGLQQVEYTDLGDWQFGGQVFGAALLWRRTLPAQTDLRAALELRALPLAAISSDHAQAFERTYDFGAGLGLQARLWYGRWPWGYTELDAALTWIRALDTPGSSHLASQLGARVDVPLWRGLGLGAALDLMRRHSEYARFAAVTRTSPQLRLFVSLR